MVDLSWFVGATEYSLSDRNPYYSLGHKGFGMPPIRRLEERGPLQDGVTDRGYRYDPRVIILSLGIKGDDQADFYSKRSSLINIFKARNTAGKLRFVVGSITRQIDGHLVGNALAFDDDNRDRLFQRVGIAIKCPDPRWYDPSMQTVTFELGGGDDTLVVPYEVPYKLGASTIDVSKTITYAGNIKSYPTIRITGPIENAIITHNTTGYVLDFTGTTIAADDYYEIDLGYSDNTIVDSAGTNKIDDLTDDSDLVEWAIEASPEVAGGVNSINVSGSGVDADTKVDVTYYDMYTGI